MQTSTYSEEQLLQGIRSRDRTVMEYLNREFRSSIRFLIFRMGGHPADAQDIFQDAMIDLINMADNPDFVPRSSIRTLLYAICKNRWRNQIREKKRIIRLKHEEHDHSVEPEFAEQVDMGLYEKLFWSTFSKLPETCKKVLMLYFRNHQNREIARMLNLSEAYVRKRKSLCTRRMIENIMCTSEYRRLMAMPVVS